MTYCA